MLHQAIAERFGLNSTDLKCLDLARNDRQLTETTTIASSS
jgi:hypothetical protein